MWEVEKLIKKGDYQYALVRNHPNSTKNGYVLYHRIIMENHLGRLLNKYEVVHHINHDKFDNRIENLEILSCKEHSKKHGLEKGRKWAILKCPVCGKIFKLPYNETVFQKYPKDKTKAQCCSRSCGCKLGRMKQLNKVTDEMKTAISGNLLFEYIKYSKDNPEVTLD